LSASFKKKKQKTLRSHLYANDMPGKFKKQTQLIQPLRTGAAKWMIL
jgi:hypothetical protein